MLGRMLESGDPHCTHALSYVLMSRLARCTLGLQRKMHSEAEAQIGRRKTAYTQSLVPKACITRRNPGWGCSQTPHKDLWSSTEHQQYGLRTQVGCHCAQPLLDCAGQPGVGTVLPATPVSGYFSCLLGKHLCLHMPTLACLAIQGHCREHHQQCCSPQGANRVPHPF